MPRRFQYHIAPVPKPRMTQRDKWKSRPTVLRYHAFKDQCKAAGIELQQSGMVIVFNMPMPKSWSKKKKAEMIGKPHQQKPDLDNLVKALFDACLAEDCEIWQFEASKVWAETGSILIREGGNKCE